MFLLHCISIVFGTFTWVFFWKPMFGIHNTIEQDIIAVLLWAIVQFTFVDSLFRRKEVN